MVAPQRKKKAPKKPAAKKPAAKKPAAKKPAAKKPAAKKPAAKKPAAKKPADYSTEPPPKPEEQPLVLEIRALVGGHSFNDIAPYLGQTLHQILYPEQAPALPRARRRKKKNPNGSKTPRQLVAEARREDVLKFLKGKKDVRKSDLMEAFPDHDPQAIWRALSRLCAEGRIDATGTTRDRVYNGGT